MDDVKVGQIWKHKKTGRKIRIATLIWSRAGKLVDTTYRTVEKGRAGAIFVCNLHRYYILDGEEGK